ncbi:flavin monoamine oxidase family protein [Pseudoalteromonas sp. 1_2015MBL_MicDiv]|uniref:flavin monoamine oxidase family protein n=1 Tax=Pseudoalteromonas sp. 1_2015MBL_MicDiv TaxID=1720343 RepID=UPI000BBE0810|nr:FAD-dependent oxidoreductase [Pseudoalteromonas sp. 1_2015MBL_MicDiv]ATG77356.1 monoamine oxidase [Pseudoalteromonas sp. 1_2015MBL_MicDiv]
MIKPVIIIGGGLAGLYSAYQLRLLNTPYLLLEAKSQLGGRIYSAQSPINSGVSFDLGPTWIFPHQPKIQALIKSLNLSLFEQYTKGDVLYQSPHSEQPQQIAGAGEMQLFRLKHGMNTLITALYEQLNPDFVLLNHNVTELKKSGDSWQITVNHLGNIKHFNTNKLMSAIPARMVTAHLTPEQWATPTLISRLNSVPTWMAGQAKFIATFEHAFWRDNNLSGQCFNRVGPMVEIHDASAEDDNYAALFGFIGMPYLSRSEVTKEQLIQACVQQLSYFYGQDAKKATGYFIKDWAEDELVANEDDRTQSSQHPEFNFSGLGEQLSNLNIHFVASEFAKQEAGYLEGAINAVDEAINSIISL